MIKTNGYYLEAPKSYEDFAGSHRVEGFCHNSYKFNNDKSFLIGTKYNRSLDVSFLESDFDSSEKNRYEIIDGKLKLIFNYDKDWEHEEIMYFHDENTLCIEDKVLTFHSWN